MLTNDLKVFFFFIFFFYQYRYLQLAVIRIKIVQIVHSLILSYHSLMARNILRKWIRKFSNLDQ